MSKAIDSFPIKIDVKRMKARIKWEDGTQPIDTEASLELSAIVSQIKGTDAIKEWEQQYGYRLEDIALPDWERVVFEDE